MSLIIDFLRGESGNELFRGDTFNNRKLFKSYDYIKNHMVSSDIKESNIFHNKSKPKIKKGQIWLCKQQYYDALGNEIIGNIPYLVLVVNDIDNLAGEEFVRIQPISPFTEFAANDDILIKDDTIIGFDFMIETWNEQPVLAELLDEFVGSLDIEHLKVDETELSLSSEQKEFRKTEIRNTAYLRQSVNSLIEFDELSDESAVLVNINNSVYFPKSEDNETKPISYLNEPKQDYSFATKKDKLHDSIETIFEETVEDVEINIKVIKKGDQYILSVKQPENIVVKNIYGKIMKQTTQNLYNELKGGLYFIKAKGIEKEIRLRLK